MPSFWSKEIKAAGKVKYIIWRYQKNWIFNRHWDLNIPGRGEMFLIFFKQFPASLLSPPHQSELFPTPSFVPENLKLRKSYHQQWSSKINTKKDMLLVHNDAVLSPYLWKAFETRKQFFGIWSTEEIRCGKCDPQNWGWWSELLYANVQ